MRRRTRRGRFDHFQQPTLEALEPRILLAADIQVFAPGNVEILEGHNYDFGTAPQGSTFERVFRLRNAGDAVLSVTGWDDLGAGIVEEPPVALQPGQEIQLTLQMQTWNSGPAGGTMQLYSNDPDEATFDFTVSGTITPAPALALTGLPHGSEVEFGSVVAGGVASEPIRLISFGDLPLTITGYDITGGFWLSHNLPASLPAGNGQFDFNVRMPTFNTGTRSGTLTIYSNDADQPAYTVTLTGTVRTPVPQIALAPANHNTANFGLPHVGDASVIRHFTIRNPGDGDLIIGSISLPNGFSIAAPLPSQTIAAGQSSGFSVSLSTAAAGTYSGDIVVTSNAAASPTTLAITGRVVAYVDETSNTSDFDGDGRNDLVAQHGVLIQAARHDGTLIALPRIYAPGWKLVGAGDLDGDQDPDLLFRHETTGRNAVWRMNGTQFESVVLLPWAKLPWRVAGIGDFNGDGVGDIAWRHLDGRNVVWSMDNAQRAAVIDLPWLEVNWQAGGVTDFDGDGKADLLFRDSTSARCATWLMNGATLESASIIEGRYDPRWQIADARDYDGDGYGDIYWRYPETNWRGTRMTGEVWRYWDGQTRASTQLTYVFRPTTWRTPGENNADLIDLLAEAPALI